MGSPQIEVVFVYDSSGVPLTGQTLAFTTYKDDLGVNLAQPAISEIGGGAYKFTPVFADPARSVIYVLSTGAGGYPEHYARMIRPEDFVETKLDELLQIQKGKWEIKSSGVDANRLIIYDADGVTVLKKFNLYDKDGLPTATNPYKRDPIP